MIKFPAILLLIGNSRAYDRGLTRGIAQYARLHGPWVFYSKPQDYMSKKTGKKGLIEQIKKWQIDGIIMTHTQKTDNIIALGIPTIVANSTQEFPNAPLVLSDAVMVGKIAAQHFVNRGFQNFAYCGFENMAFSQARAQSFADNLSDQRFKTDFYKQKKTRLKKNLDQLASIAQWIESLPKPLALMACNDDRGRDVLQACKIAEIRVPEEVAVLGVDNDDLICELTDPPLSSISLNSQKTGYEIAESLSQMMAGQNLNGQLIKVNPTHVETRPSTDILAIDDPDVAAAIQFIRNNSAKPIQVEEVAAYVGMSRRNLYKRFRRTLGRTVHDEISRIRIDRVTNMLMNTSMSVTQIALSTGYAGTEKLIRHFKREKGMTPLTWRKQHGPK